MSWQYTDGYNGTYNMTLPKSTSSLVSLPLLDKDNPIQLAALSNYKLAQLTFLTPDCDSLRKTALIKNTNEAIYMDTPTEWLNRMRRWQFFTPESLTNMTQEGLELVFAQYIQIIEAFKPASVNVEEEENGDDDGDDEVWPKDEIPTPDRNISTNSTTVPLVMEYSLYAQAGASMDLLHGKEFKPLPDRPITFSRTVGGGVTTGVAMAQDRRKSIASLRNRLSWTSDTGLLPNSLIGHAWANELMAMFDMEFQVDTNLTLNTAPTLPELPFSSRHKRQSQRYSTDSFMNLIPTFETFKLQESERRITSVSRPRNMTFPPPPPTTPPPTITPRPRSSTHPIATDQHSQSIFGRARSSSVKCDNHQSSVKPCEPSTPKHRTVDIWNGLANIFSGVTFEKSLTRKKSIRRLAALITGNIGSDNKDNSNNDNKQRPSLSSSSSSSSLSTLSSTRFSLKHLSPNIYQAPPANSTQNGSHYLSITSTSSNNSNIDIPVTKSPFMHHKPLPEIPLSVTTDIKRRRSVTCAPLAVTTIPRLERSKSVGYRPKHHQDALKTMITSNKRQNSDSVNSITSQDSSGNQHRNCTSLNPAIPSDTMLHKEQYLLDTTPTSTNHITTSTPRPKRSPSTLMKLGRGFSKRHAPKSRTMTNGDTENNFVTRMASLRKRMKLQLI